MSRAYSRFASLLLVLASLAGCASIDELQRRRIFQPTREIAGTPTDWRAVFNAWFRHRSKGYLSTFEGIYAPWSHLLRYVPDLKVVQERFLGSGYLAVGSAAPPAGA